MCCVLYLLNCFNSIEGHNYYEIRVVFFERGGGEIHSEDVFYSLVFIFYE